MKDPQKAAQASNELTVGLPADEVTVTEEVIEPGTVTGPTPVPH